MLEEVKLAWKVERKCVKALFSFNGKGGFVACDEKCFGVVCTFSNVFLSVQTHVTGKALYIFCSRSRKAQALPFLLL